MAAGTSTIYFRGAHTGKPQVVSIYEAGSDAALAILPAASEATATANSIKTFMFDEDMIMTDFIARSTTGGVYRFLRAGTPTQATMNAAAHGGTNAGRPRLGYKFKAGVTYSVQVVTALDA